MVGKSFVRGVRWSAVKCSLIRRTGWTWVDVGEWGEDVRWRPPEIPEKSDDSRWSGPALPAEYSDEEPDAGAQDGSGDDYDGVVHVEPKPLILGGTLNKALNCNTARNSLILYDPSTSASAPIAGSIEKIISRGDKTSFIIRHQAPLPTGEFNPLVR
ncbi:hypothetical protein DFH07DRAFT_776664 [Mycena maculata]|uniref:Uncharacterized protein n=1 Tax=Mycena maculata TaxID=230809 RepID=A0AAD7IKT3_9AGAR|nr:hypothetical protein DFH07DRAFT_776664 [Mycena maculata]